jgi:hypothetical protein
MVSKPPLYEIITKSQVAYKIDFPGILKDGSNVAWDEFSTDAGLLFYAGRTMKKVDNNSELGVFLNSLK